MTYETLILSGGSVQSIIQLGALQYFKDQNILNNFKNFVGTSAGSIICYLLIINYSPIEIVVYLCTNYQLFEKLKCFDLVSASRGEGATSFVHISEQIEKMTIEKTGRLFTLKDLEDTFNKKLVCVTYNITKACQEIISSENNPTMPCLIALRMSCNLPLIFENFKYNDSFYIDGGLINHFPIDIGESFGKNVLAVGLRFDIKEDNPHINLLEYVYKLLLLPIHENVMRKIDNKKETTRVIYLESNSIKFFNFDINSKTKLEMFSKGYEDAKNLFEFIEVKKEIDKEIDKEISNVNI